MSPVVPEPKIRFALIGCGRVAQKHLAALAQHATRAELVAVCDADRDAAAEASRLSGAPAYAELGALLEAERPEVVILCTPSALHPSQAVEAARAGCHVVTEKPMATQWGEAREMVRACEEAAVRLFVVKQMRYSPPLQLLKKALLEGRFGRLHLVTANVLWTRPQAYYDAAPWRGTWAFDGGALMNQASHYVDLLTWLIGPVAQVHAFGGALARQIEAEDTAVLNLRWPEGTLGSMSVTMLTYPRNLEASLTIIGEQGTARLGGVACDRIEHWAFDDGLNDREAIEKASEAALGALREGHGRLYENVLDVLRGQAEPDTDGREGLKSLELILAAYQSIREGRPVTLPLDDARASDLPVK